MRKLSGLALVVIVGGIIGFGLLILGLSLNIGVALLANEKHSYTLGEIGQNINSAIPADATDIIYSSETRYGYFVKLSFKAPPDSAVKFAKRICDETPYQGYDPFSAVDSFSSKPNSVIVKWTSYAYFSRSTTPPAIYGIRCQLKSRPFSAIQVKVDQTNPRFYVVQFELLEDACVVRVTCSGYGIENAATHPLPKNSPVPLIVYGFDENNQYVLSGQQLCLETDPGLFYDWDKPPFDLNELRRASFELFIDDVSKGKAKISDQGRLSADYSTGKFVGLHESPEYCFEVESPSGTHKMSIDVKTIKGKEYRYSWDFRKA